MQNLALKRYYCLLPATRRITVTVKSQSTINASREATSMTTNNGAAKSLTKLHQHKISALPTHKPTEVGTIAVVPTDLISPASNNLPFGHGRFSALMGGPLL